MRLLLVKKTSKAATNIKQQCVIKSLLPSSIFQATGHYVLSYYYPRTPITELGRLEDARDRVVDMMVDGGGEEREQSCCFNAGYYLVVLVSNGGLKWTCQ
jgi:hypothetical protein